MLAKVKLAKQTKTSLGPGVAAQRAENEAVGKGEGVGDSARVMARQAHALCEQVKRLTVRRRIGSDRSEVEVGVRVKRSLVLAGRQAGQLGGEWGVCLAKPLLDFVCLQVARCSAAIAPPLLSLLLHLLLQRRPQFIYFKT